MLWKCLPLPRPQRGRSSSGATPKDKHDDDHVQGRVPLTIPAADRGDAAEEAFDVNPKAESADVVFFPELPGTVQLRRRWYMRRRQGPMVPAPSNKPMPDKARNQEGKARLFALYLRPWVLDHRFAIAEVPHTTILDVVPGATAAVRVRLLGKHAPQATQRRSYAEAWRWYVRGHVVSQHATRLIVQFMAACCGKSKGGEDVDETLEQPERLREIPANALPLTRVHAILERMSQGDGSATVPVRPVKL